MDDLHHLDDSLRSIRLDATDTSRAQQLSLDKMFSRAHAWHDRVQASRCAALGPDSVVRPASPPRNRPIHPLPRPLEGSVGISPLAKLFEYPELIPHVLDEFHHPREMAVLCRVSKGFERLVRKRLYDYIWVRPWEENCHSKLVLLFDTLSKSPELCRLIKRLDVRFFPLAARGGERYDLDDQVRLAIANMTNLEHLVWTRDKSLHPGLVEHIAQLPKLRTLEISGHSYRYYNPRVLGRLPALEDLRFMMPDQAVRDHLFAVARELDERPQGGLRGLGMICRSSPLVDDALLRDLAPHLSRLRRLALWGCSRITRSGLFSVLQDTEDLEELSVDALPHSGILDTSRAPELPRLHTFSISMTAPHRTPLFLSTDDLPRLPPTQALSALHITLSGARSHLPAGGVEHLTAQTDFSQLRKLSLLNLVLSAQQLSALLQAAPELEELYISVNGKQALFDCPDLGGHSGGKLRIFHVTAPEKWAPAADDLALLAERMRALEQIGTGNRVYEVFRKEAGEMELARWSRAIVPGYFQVWRG